jgi:hypothetical protein
MQTYSVKQRNGNKFDSEIMKEFFVLERNNYYLCDWNPQTNSH